MMEELTERQKFILSMVIREYVRSAKPVGSKNLVDDYHLDLSPATVRHELAVLTDMGYLIQPHTSAGRVPSETGYRYFVGQLSQETELPEPVRHTISHQFYQTRHDIDQWMRLAASVLAHQSKVASLVTAPHPEEVSLKHIQLISTYGCNVLMVMVLVGGEIRQRILTTPQPLTQDQLSQISTHLTSLLHGLDQNSMQTLASQLQPLEADFVQIVLQEIKQANMEVAGEIYLDGLTSVLAEPEFVASEGARRALRVLEERTLLQDLVARALPANNIGGVQVLIGGEGTHEELRQVSLIFSRYGTPGQATGFLGALGPIRMSYGRTISTMRFLSSILSDMVAGTLID